MNLIFSLVPNKPIATTSNKRPFDTIQLTEPSGSKSITSEQLAPAVRSVEPVDFMIPLCAVYLQNGWNMVASVANRHGITEEQIKEELKQRKNEVQK